MQDIVSQNNTQINEINKYAQIGKISSGLLHDLISPITALNIQIQNLDETSIQNPEYLRSIKDAVVNVSNYSKLIKDYISGSSEKETLELGEEVQNSIELISYKAIKENISIQFIREKGIEILARKVHIYQIIISLLTNAIEAYEDKHLNRKVIIKLERENNEILISIQDFGKGIEDTDKIFEPFYTTKTSAGGTGIGLSTVKHLVESEFLGRIIVQSQINQGSLFKIYFKTDL